MKLKVTTIAKGITAASVLLAMLFGFIGTSKVKADINPLLNFAGKVTNLDGSEMPDSAYDFSFGLYTVATGSSPIWSEDLSSTTCFSATINTATVNTVTYTSGTATSTLRAGQYLSNGTNSSLIVSFDTDTNTITVADDVSTWTGAISNRPWVEGGVVDVALGTVQSLINVNFDQPLYLQVTFRGEEMQPRKLLPAQAYAFEAAKLGGKTANEFAGLADDETITGAWNFNNIVSIASSSDNTLLTITQNGSGNIVEFKQGATTSLAVLANGLVKIGEYTFPYYHGAEGEALLAHDDGTLYWGTPVGGGTVNLGTGGQIAYYDHDNTLSATSLIFLATTTNRVGIGTTGPSVLLHVGSSTPIHVSGYQDTFLSGGLEVNDLLYVNGTGTSTIAGNLNILGDSSFGIITGGTWRGNTINAAYGGTGIDSSGWNGVAVIDGGVWSASSTLAMSRGGTGNTGFSNGSLIFSNGSILTEDNSNLYWDNTAKGLGIGTSTLASGATLTVGGNLTISNNGNIMPTGSSTVGSAANRFTYGYFNRIDVLQGIDIASTSISGTAGNIFTINSSNATDDAEDSTLAFYRGSSATSIPSSATLTWRALADRFEFNYPLYIYDESGTGSTTLTVVAGGSQGNQPLIQWQDNAGNNLGLISSNGYLALGTTTASYLLSVGATSSSQFLVDGNGTVVQGTWNGNAIDAAHGGTGLGIIPSGYTLIGTGGTALQATSTIFIKDNGFVGIGTNNPATNFSVNGTTTTSNAFCIGGSCLTSWENAGIGGKSTSSYVTYWSNTNILAGEPYLSVVRGGLGRDMTAGGSGMLVYSTSNDTYGTTSVGNWGDVLTSRNTGAPTWMSTSSLSINLSDTTGMLQVNQGGTGSTTLSGLLKGNGISGILSAVLGTDYYGPGYITPVNWGGTGLDTVPSGYTLVGTGGNALTATSAIYIDPISGFVGIGTTNPTTALSVVGTTTSSLGFCIGNSCLTSWLQAGGLTGDGSASHLTYWNGDTSIGYISDLYLSGNNLGFGTSTPLDKVSIVGDIGIHDQNGLKLYQPQAQGFNYVSLKASSTLDSSTTYYWPSDGASGKALMTDSNGNLYWGNPEGSGTINSGTIGQLAYYVDNTNHLGATSTIFIKDNGFVGIGTNNPTTNLSVNGTTTTSNAFCIGSSCLTNWDQAGDLNGSGDINHLTYWTAGKTISSIDDLYYSSNNLSFGTTTANDKLSIVGNIGLLDQSGIKLYQPRVNGLSSISLQASSTLAGNTTYYWPSDGASGKALMTDSHGNLYWGNPEGSGTINSGTIGQLAYYVDNTNHLGATSTIFIASNGYVGIGTTTSINNLLTVGATPSYQFIINSSGQVTAGTWRGSAVTVPFGGTGSTTLTYNGILYGNGIGNINATASGTYGQLLTANASGVPTWMSTSSLAIPTGTGTNNYVTYWTGTGSLGATSTLAVNVGGTGWNSSASSGIAVLDNGVWSASSTLATYRGGFGISTAGFNGLAFKPNGGDWTSTTTLSVAYGGTGLNSVPSGYTLVGTGGNLQATSTIFIKSNGFVGIGTNTPTSELYVKGTTTLEKICLGSKCLSSWSDSGVGQLGGSGASANGQPTYWVDDYTLGATSTISMVYGGTGKALAPTSGGIVYSDSDSLEMTAAGTWGQVLTSRVAGTPVWMSTSSLSINLSDMIGTLAVSKGGTGSTTLTYNGILYGNGIGNINATASGTYGQLLTANASGVPTWMSTSSLAIPTGTGTNNYVTYWTGTGSLGATSTLAVNVGGTGWNSSASSGIAVLDNGVWSASSTLATYRGGFGISTAGFNGLAFKPNGGDWTSTTTLSVAYGGTGLNSVPSGYTLVGTGGNLQATSTIFIKSNGFVGIGTNTPTSELYVKGTTTLEKICLGSKCLSSWSDSGVGQLGGSGASANGQPTYWVDDYTLGATSTISMVYGGTGKALAPTSGGIVYSDSDSLEMTAAGTWGQVLTSRVAGTPVWMSTSSLSINLSDMIGTLAVSKGGTGSTTLTYNGILYGNGIGNINATASGTYGQLLTANASGVPTWMSTSSLAIPTGTGTNNYVTYWTGTGSLGATSTLAVNVGGTGWNSSASSGIAVLDNGVWSASSTLATYRGGFGISTAGFNGLAFKPNGGDWTSTTTLSVAYGGTGLNSVPSGYTLVGTGGNLQATSTIFIKSNGFVGIGTNTPTSELYVKGTTTLEKICLGGVCQSSWDGTGVGSIGGNGIAGQVTYWETTTRIVGTSTLSVNVGGTGANAFTAGTVLYGNGANAIGTTSVGNWGEVLTSRIGGMPVWMSTSSLGINLSDMIGTLAVSKGGTGTSTPPSYGKLLIGNASGGYDYIASTSLGGSNGTVDSSLSGYAAFYQASGKNISGTSTLFIDASGKIGIGTTTPLLSLLNIDGNLLIAGASRYINFGTSSNVGDLGYGFRDNNGTMQYKNSGNDIWYNIGTAGSAGVLGSLSDVSAGGAIYGDLLMYDGSRWINSSTSTLYGTAGQIAYYAITGKRATGTSAIFINPSGYIGIGTTTNINSLLTVGATSSYQFIVNNIGQVTQGTWNGSFIDVAHGGTGSTTLTYNGILYGNGTGNINATASSTVYGQVLIGGTNGVPTWMATSSLGLSGQTNYGLAGQIAYYAATGTSATGTSAIFINPSGYVGIGTTSPTQRLDVFGRIALDGITVAYRPTDMTGTLILGNGGTNLSHVSPNEGYYNTFVGLGSGTTTAATGYRNTFVGFDSGAITTTGYRNVALGSYSLYSNVSGYQNTGIGDVALYSNISGNNNVAVGTNALYSNTAGDNTAVGVAALYNITTGSSNVALGGSAGRSYGNSNDDNWLNQTSNSSIYIGDHTRALANGDTNEIVIGASAVGIGSNSVVLGSSSILTTALRGNVGIGTTTNINNLLTVGATSGNQFIINSSGQVTQGTWYGNFIDVARGGTGSTTLTYNGILYGNGTGAINATASSTVYGQVLIGGTNGVPTWMATSSLGLSGQTLYGTAGQIAYYPNNGTSASGTSAIFIDTNGRVGIGTTTNMSNILTVGSTTGSQFTVGYNGNIGIGTTSPTHSLGIKSTTTNSAELQFYTTDYGGVINVAGGGTQNNLYLYSGNNYIIASGVFDLWRSGISYIKLDSLGASYFNGGNVGIGTTTNINSLLTVGATSSYQFIVNNIGQVTQGTWNGSFIDVAHGGTGSTTLTYNGILYGNGTGAINATASSTVYGQVLIGGTNGVPTWMATSSLGLSGQTLYGTTGQIAYYPNNGTSASGTSAVFINSSGYIGIGTTTNINSLLTVGATSSQQFIVNNLGQVTQGTWQGNAIGVGYGGTNWNSTASSGIAVLNSGVWSASSTLAFYRGGTGLSSINQGYTLFASADNTLTATSAIYINATTGYVGLGTTTPLARLGVNGDIYLQGASRYINFGTSTLTGAGGYGFRDNNGTMEYKNSNGSSWVGINAGSLDSLSNVTFGTLSYGDLFMYNSVSSKWVNTATTSLGLPMGSGSMGQITYWTGGNNLGATSSMFIATNGYVGIGTTTPSAKLTVFSGDGNPQLRLAYDQSTFANFQVAPSGTLTINTTNNTRSMLWIGDGLTNKDNGIIFDGAPNDYYINLSTSTNNLQIGIGTNLSTTTTYLTIASSSNIGIGTTTPIAKLTIIDTNATSGQDVLFISTSTSGAIFRVDGSGKTYGDGSYTQGADYAEYFYTNDTDLKSGDVMCMEVAANNQVKRCDRGEDSNVIGIVSTRPAVVGNYKKEYAGNENYIVVGLIGQIPAKVSTENGPIRTGDSLTPASSTPGYAMRANAGDPTVGVALEGLDGDAENVVTGTINVLIARQNKGLTVEMVEDQVTQRIADMQIEDEVRQMLEQAITNYKLDDKVSALVTAQLQQFDQALTVKFDTANTQILKVASSVDSLALNFDSLAYRLNNIDSRLAAIENWKEGMLTAKSEDMSEVLTITEEGNIRIGDLSDYSTSTPDVAVFELTTSTTTNKTALVINQRGAGDVADFQTGGVSVVNIADSGRVTIVGEMLVDGRIMICTGGACGDSLNNAVDETMGDMGVEGTVVAGAFASYCEDGYIWIPGSSKYGTMPGFCVAADLEKVQGSNDAWTNVSQGEAQLACQSKGSDYHLITENEWLTIAENIIRVKANDIGTGGLLLATTPEQAGSTTISYVLSNDNIIKNLVGTIAEWTDQTITKNDLVAPLTADWQEYYVITDYRGLNIAPPYYYNSSNGIGKIRTGAGDNILSGFVRGANGIYSLDLSNSPTIATSTVGFRCAE